VNPWALPYQKPIPPTIIPGVLSRETAAWAAERDYPYLGLGGALQPCADTSNYYADQFAARGLQAGPENFGHVVFVYVDEDPDRAQQIGRALVYGGGNSNFAKAQYTLPAGFNSAAAIKRLANVPQSGWLGVTKERLDEETVEVHVDTNAESRARTEATYQRMVNDLMIIVGTPDQVTEKIKTVMRCLRPGMLIMMGPQGDISHEDRSKSIELIGNHVLPELRLEAQRLNLTDMFETKPGSNPLTPGQPRAAVVDQNAIDEINAARIT
jgi:alkanesulfonate monooxygenase SsuD/methylene tetrahydromethanopterin reductase-like flavin-dependent oxidoreductase (luciferase family)